mmetsp:Transcript_37593/g.89770  ORF Transcript_37593/g.89770 Transcript_37593/m.89770 type:complete len:254 (+) Transcript_37593:608-1369(+)
MLQINKLAVKFGCQAAGVLLNRRHASNSLQGLKAVPERGDAQEGHCAVLEPLGDAALEHLQVVTVCAPGPGQGHGATSPVVLLQFEGRLSADDECADAGWIAEQLVKGERDEVGLGLCQVQGMAGGELGCVKKNAPRPEIARSGADLRSPAEGEDLPSEVLFRRVREQRKRPVLPCLRLACQLIQPFVDILVPRHADGCIEVSGNIADAENRVVILQKVAILRSLAPREHIRHQAERVCAGAREDNLVLGRGG